MVLRRVLQIISTKILRISRCWNTASSRWFIEVLHINGRWSSNWRCLWVFRSWRSSWIQSLSQKNGTPYAGTTRDLRRIEKGSLWMVKALESKTKRSQIKIRTTRSNSRQYSSQRSSRRKKKITLTKKNVQNQDVLILCISSVYVDTTPHR